MNNLTASRNYIIAIADAVAAGSKNYLLAVLGGIEMLAVPVLIMHALVLVLHLIIDIKYNQSEQLNSVAICTSNLRIAIDR